MAFQINDFKAALKYGGARTSNFQVIITNPANSGADSITPFMVKAAALPESTIEPLNVPYFGRDIKLAGKRTYSDWTVTVINDEDFLVKNALEQWHNFINAPEGNVSKFATSSPNEYKSTIQVLQFDKSNNITRVYTLVGAFPTTQPLVELNWDTPNIQEFQVTFAYDYHLVEDGITGNAGGI